jgi:NAD-dependent dihydropyrimidine dehydrogenase PreA subunit
MNIRKVKLVYFSPTGTGKKTVNEIAAGIGFDTDTIDLTRPDADLNSYKLEKDELAIFAVPVYGGRVPQTALDRLETVRGDNTPAVLVAAYGNRAYEDALLELHNTTKELGFKTIAGAVFIGQHSFDAEETPIATGRPDAEDLKKAHEFGAKVLEKIKGMDEVLEIDVPGNDPYRERGGGDPRSPETDEATCTLCGTCASVCPTGCVEVSDVVKTQKDQCIACTACVQSCPTGARHWEHEGILGAAKWLSTEHGDRKEPEVFF